jgi:hypothetical protein
MPNCLYLQFFNTVSIGEKFSREHKINNYPYFAHSVVTMVSPFVYCCLIYSVFCPVVLLESCTQENNPKDVDVMGTSKSTLGSDSGVETG